MTNKCGAITTDYQHWIDRDIACLWHPCAQMKDYEQFPPLLIQKAEGPYLYLHDGRVVIDAISSWWCKSLGHAHPFMKAALIKQANTLEHVLLANTTHTTVVRLAERLCSMSPSLNHVMLAGDGSCAVEMALKLSFHARKIAGQISKKRFMALKQGYHGETLLALSVSDQGVFCKDYQELLLDVPFLQDIPYVQSTQDPLWNDCSSYWPSILAQLDLYRNDLTAIILEPIVQGAAGMQIYSQDFLYRLRLWCTQHDVHLIADEIMTGFYRTGRLLACEHAGIEPDFLCLGKALTGGWLPMSAVLMTSPLYDTFYQDYECGHNFLHSHTQSGNALAAALACAHFEALEMEHIAEKVQQHEIELWRCWRYIAQQTGLIHRIRCLGAVAAADLQLTPEQAHQRAGYQVYRYAVQRGALLRPIGHTLYWLLPLNSDKKVFEQLTDITIKALEDFSRFGYES